MTGDDIRQIRTDLGTDPTQFSQLLGIHSSTLYRWEKLGPTTARVEPMQRQLLAVLQQQLVNRAPEDRISFGKKIQAGLLNGGGLLGLYYLLEANFRDRRLRAR